MSSSDWSDSSASSDSSSCCTSTFCPGLEDVSSVESSRIFSIDNSKGGVWLSSDPRSWCWSVAIDSSGDDLCELVKTSKGRKKIVDSLHVAIDPRHDRSVLLPIVNCWLKSGMGRADNRVVFKLDTDDGEDHLGISVVSFEMHDESCEAQREVPSMKTMSFVLRVNIRVLDPTTGSLRFVRTLTLVLKRSFDSYGRSIAQEAFLTFNPVFCRMDVTDRVKILMRDEEQWFAFDSTFSVRLWYGAFSVRGLEATWFGDAMRGFLLRSAHDACNMGRIRNSENDECKRESEEGGDYCDWFDCGMREIFPGGFRVEMIRHMISDETSTVSSQ